MNLAQRLPSLTKKYWMTIAKKSKKIIALWVVILITIIGFLDYITGGEVSFSIFYSIPISLSAWFLGRKLGFATAIVSAFIWYKIDATTGIYSHPMIPIWNAGVRLAFFITIIFLLLHIKKLLDREKVLARTDTLTGACNSRYFCDLLELEIKRSKRYQYPFTVVYIDLDNFKLVNDQYGHQAGDRALYIVVQFLKENLRKIDTISRLGGDEFALLFPEMSQATAKSLLSKLQSGLLEKMQQQNWPITFSMGALTCLGTSQSTSVDRVIGQADTLMFEVKRHQKNNIIYGIFEE